jgi:hypothetical protein
MAGKSPLFASIIFLLAAPLPSIAETLSWGQVELKAGQAHISNSDAVAILGVDDRDPRTYDFAGRIGADWGAFGAALDLTYGARDIDPNVYTGYYWGRAAIVRANYDLSSAYALGAAYGAGSLDNADDDGANFDFYALEAAGSAGAGVYGLQFGAFDGSDPDETDVFHDGSFVRGSAIYTLGNGGVIEGEIAYFDGKQDNGAIYNMHAYTWGIEYSQQFGAKPFAWSVGLDGGTYDNGDDIGDNRHMNETRVTLGLTAWFGDDDLSSAKKRGIFSQPDFGRVVAAGNDVD